MVQVNFAETPGTRRQPQTSRRNFSATIQQHGGLTTAPAAEIVKVYEFVDTRRLPELA